MFAFVVIGSLTVILLVQVGVYYYTRSHMPRMAWFEFIPVFLLKTVVWQVVVTVLGFALWFFVSQKMWVNFSDECIQGWNLLDFINFCLIMLYTFAYAMVLLTIVLVGICCCPCIVLMFGALR